MHQSFFYSLILLTGLSLSGCGTFGTLRSSPTTPPPAPANPFLVGLTETELTSVTAEAMRVYGPDWAHMAARSRYVRQPLLQALKNAGAPLQLQMVPVVESSYNPYAVSEVGATGLWQLMPETATDLRIHTGADLDGRRDIVASSRGAARFLLKQHRRFGSWPLAFAAYHLGPGAVQRRIDRHPWQNGDGLQKIPLPPITKTYIRHILGLIALQRRGTLTFPEPYATQTITMRSPVDLARLQQQPGISRNRLFRFNPKLEHMQYFHQPAKGITLHLPHPAVARIRKSNPSAQADMLNIRVQRHESIRDICRRYHLSAYTLKKVNPALKHGLKAGMALHIPVTALQRAEVSANPLIRQPVPLLIAGSSSPVVQD